VQRLKWFAYALEHGGNASLACRYFGIARTTYMRWAGRFDPRDPLSLEEESRRPLRMREPETPPHVVALIRDIRTKQPLLGKEKIAETLRREYGVDVSASTVGRTIARYGFFFAGTPSHERKRAASSHTAFDRAPSDPVREDLGGASAYPLLPDPLAS
jgi:transposase